MNSELELSRASSFDNICRACLSTESEGIAFIFDVTYENISLPEIFYNCVSLQVERDDTLPKSICKGCIALLVQMYTFKQQCHRSDKLLRAVLSEQSHNLTNETGVEHNLILKETKNNQKAVKQAADVEERSLRSRRKPTCENKIQEEVQHEIQNTSCSLEVSKMSLYSCKYCSESFDSHNKLKLHRKQVKHPRSRNYKCPECYKSFSYSHLQQHMRTHTKEKPFPCHICQMRFSLKCNLRRHMMIHTGERPHTCDICGKGFIQATTLVDHKRIHTGETPYICSYCGMSFGQSSRHKAHLRRHLIENGQTDKLTNNYECDICHRQFTTRGILKTHMLTHGEKTFLCSQCGKGFVSNAGLLSHMKVHTGIKPYSCTVCNKAFSQLGSLKSHMLIHTGQKPFICKVCSKAFTQRNHLKYHIRTHSGERPYVCVYCGKSFALKGTLTIHVRTHTGETPYVCDVCGKGFYDSSSMKKHKRGHGQLEEKIKIANQLKNRS